MGIIHPSGGDGASLVSCVLVRSAAIDIHALGSHDLAWDGLVDNGWDFNPLVAIPAGLGLNFAFDGSAGTVTTTTTGTWAFTYWLIAAGDVTWAGTLEQPLFQTTWPGGGGNTNPFGVSALFAAPSGVALTQVVVTRTAATANPYNLSGALLYVSRLA